MMKRPREGPSLAALDASREVRSLCLTSSYPEVAMRVRLSSKAQLVIPSVVRRRHGFGPETEFELLEQDDALLLRPVRERPREGRLEEVFGCLGGFAQKRVSIEAMDRGLRAHIRRAWCER